MVAKGPSWLALIFPDLVVSDLLYEIFFLNSHPLRLSLFERLMIMGFSTVYGVTTIYYLSEAHDMMKNVLMMIKKDKKLIIA